MENNKIDEKQISEMFDALTSGELQNAVKNYSEVVNKIYESI